MNGLCAAEIAQIVSVAAVDGVSVSVGVHGRGGAAAGVLAGALLHYGLGRAWTRAEKPPGNLGFRVSLPFGPFKSSVPS